MTDKTKPGECCAVMKLALLRPKESDRIGLMAETMYRLDGGATREVVVIRFRPSKDRKSECAGATFAEVEFCPFCGAKQSTEVTRG